MFDMTRISPATLMPDINLRTSRIYSFVVTGKPSRRLLSMNNTIPCSDFSKRHSCQALCVTLDAAGTRFPQICRPINFHGTELALSSNAAEDLKANQRAIQESFDRS